MAKWTWEKKLNVKLTSDSIKTSNKFERNREQDFEHTVPNNIRSTNGSLDSNLQNHSDMTIRMSKKNLSTMGIWELEVDQMQVNKG